MNLSHVKDWCIRYLLLDNKPRQIWYLKTILLIHSFCGSGIGLGVGWVPLVQELSSNSQGVSPGDLSKLWGRTVCFRVHSLACCRSQVLRAVGLRASAACWELAPSSLTSLPCYLGPSIVNPTTHMAADSLQNVWLRQKPQPFLTLTSTGHPIACA